MKEILKEALTDANFHSASKEVDKIFGSLSIKPYTSYNKLLGRDVEKTTANRMKFIERHAGDVGIKISEVTKWGGFDIMDGIADYCEKLKFDKNIINGILKLKDM